MCLECQPHGDPGTRTGYSIMKWIGADMFLWRQYRFPAETEKLACCVKCFLLSWKSRVTALSREKKASDETAVIIGTTRNNQSFLELKWDITPLH